MPSCAALRMRQTRSSGEMADRAIGLASRAEAAGSFLDPEIAALSDETIADWLTQEPGLEPYRHALDADQPAAGTHPLDRGGGDSGAGRRGRRRLRDHPQRAGGRRATAGQITDESGQTVRLAQGNLNRFLDSADRRVRQEAWERSADAYLAFRNTFAATLAGAVKRDVFYARARGYDSSLEAALAPETTFHARSFTTSWTRSGSTSRSGTATSASAAACSVCRKAICMATTWKRPSPSSRAFPGSEAWRLSWPPWRRWVRSTSPRCAAGMAERWIDRCANLGKGGGAFSSGIFGTEPFISMTWQDNLTSVSTLTHEIGHSMHSLLTWQQPAGDLRPLRDVGGGDGIQSQPGADGRAHAGRAG